MLLPNVPNICVGNIFFMKGFDIMEIKKVNLTFNMNKIAYGNKPTSIVLHHAEASNCSVQDVHSWHRNQGWAGIGYHYFVRKNGEIFKGREDNWIGSHCLGHNQNTIGVCFEGAYNKEKMPQAQINAGRELVSYLKSKYGISKVYRHKDLNSTDCPGANFPFSEITKVSPINNPINKPCKNVDWLTEYLKSWNWTQWVKDLQAECNAQGFSNQSVDGLTYNTKTGESKTLKGCPTLKIGARGNITKLLQRVLKAFGIANLEEDGVFGTNTYNAVIAFQKSRGLLADGMVGPNTWRKILGL